MACLDDNQVTAFVERQLDGAAWTRVVAHLDACERCLGLTCAVAATLGDDSAEPPAALPAAGDRVGRYELVEMIGRGATGAVYAARDPQLGRRIALKVVRTGRYAEPRVRARLSREARALAQVAHPNVVAIHDAGELDDGIFIAMELVVGETLREWQTRRPRPWRETLEAYCDAGRGLAAAHAAGIVHRDFKPANVMVDAAGRIAVADFGLAVAPSVRDAAGADDDDEPLASTGEQPGPPELAALALTRSGTLVGTPRYMAPEAVAGGVVDARSDQYSFAVAVFEALYGAPPHAGTTIAELRAAMSRPLAPVAAPRGDALAATVPAAVHEVLARALSGDRAGRWPSMLALVDALAAVMTPTPVHGRRWPGRALGAGVVTVAVVALVAVVATGLRRTHEVVGTLGPRVPIAAPAVRVRCFVAPLANATGDALLDDTLDLVIATQLLRSARLDVAFGIGLEQLAASRGGSVAHLEPVVAALAATGTRVLEARGAIAKAGAGYELRLEATDPRLVGGVFHGHAAAATREELPVRAVALANALRRALGDEDTAWTQPLSASLPALHAYSAAQHVELAGDHAAAAAHLRAAIAADDQFVEAHAALGDVLYNASERTSAIAELDRAIAMADRMGERDRFTLMGDYAGAVGRYSESIAAYQQLLARWPGDTRTQINATATAIDAGSWPLAVELAHNAALAHPDLAITRANLVIAELGDNRLADAIRDGTAMVRDVPHPTDFGLAALMAAQALASDLIAARGTLARLAAQNADLGVLAAAELAMYEGLTTGTPPRGADAVAAVRGVLATHPGEQAGATPLVLARMLLILGDRAGAGAAAMRARGEGTARVEYLAARIVLETVGLPDAAALATSWSRGDIAEQRMFGHVLAGDVVLVGARGCAAAPGTGPCDVPGAVAAALQEYAEAEHHGSSWILHEARMRAARLGSDAGAVARERAWLDAHRGEIAVFQTPSIGLVAGFASASPDARPAGR